jgi:hypothetical protein
MPVGSARFIREGSYNLTAAIGLALGGIPAVLLAGVHREVIAADRREVAGGWCGDLHRAMMLRSAYVEARDPKNVIAA